MQRETWTRRTALTSGGLAFLALLSGCGKDDAWKPHGIDLTGSDHAKDFQLVDHHGTPRSLADFRGKAVMVFFGFTQCPDVCPTSLARAVEIKQRLGDQGAQLQVLFVTLDPERDAPQILAAYMDAFDPGFLGLRTDLERTRETAKAFKVFFQKVPTGNSYTLDHSSLTYVYDRAGQLRLAFKHEASAVDCADDLRHLLATT
jgi:protein SCO1/2